MSDVLELSFKENFFYSTHEPVSVKEIIKSLQGWDTIVKQSKDVLVNLTECDIDGIELQVELLRTGSLYEDVVIKLLFGSQEKMDDFVAKCHVIVGEGAVRNTIVFAVVAGLVGYGLYIASAAMSPETTPHFEANNNVIINIGAGEANLTPEGLKSVIESSVTNKKALAEGALKVISPARNDDNASLTIGQGSGQVVISQETIRMAPSAVIFDQSSKTVDYKDVDIQIRALDLDNPSKGWAAVVPGIIDRRVKLVLDPSLDAAALAGKMAFRGDITVTSNLNPKDGEYKPVEIMLRAFVN
ncbi:Uncharacterised protein [Yersinia rohdei]|uniref:hypothetical protein n=1 Tax=Yersinia rohdei TaxID=29485 RepID=UPI0005E20610|nr:hypothetical protein [Yersinia rohdei]CNJ54010.1 Uncharacterised protein [Yersinia rohdei]